MIVGLVALVALFAVPAGSGTPDLLAEGYRNMYNLEFNAAHRCFVEYERAHPEDPVGPVSDGAAYLFYEFERLKILRSEFFVENESFFQIARSKPDPDIKDAFETDLSKGKQLAEPMLQRDSGSERALFARVLLMALHADYEALIEKRYWQSFNEIKQARTTADMLLAKHPDYYDAYLAVGVENYLLSQKSAPVRLFLRMTGAQTDERAGIEKLRLVADKGRYLKPYAKILLAIAALRNDRVDEAKQLLKELAQEFPLNSLFQEELKKLS